MKNIKAKIIFGVCVLFFIGGFLAEDIFIRTKARAIFCDVGQGDGAFINFNKTQILVDGGPDNKFVGCIGKYMPYFDRTIEYLIISHPDKDHFVGAVEILRRYNVEQVITNCKQADIPEYDEFLELSENKLLCVKDTQSIKLDKGQIEFFFPRGDVVFKDDNDNSIIFKFTYDSKSILFTGDASERVEKMLLPLSSIWLKSDILKLGHHGSKTSSHEYFLRAVDPELAIISVGADNKFGHPSYRIIKRLENLGIKYRRTDEEGDIMIKLE